MTRRYDASVAVQEAEGEPRLFLWQGRLYHVRTVLARWQEARPWWREVAQRASGTSTAPPDGGALLALARDRVVWRVEAGAGRSRGTGVFDLVADAGQWSLARVSD